MKTAKAYDYSFEYQLLDRCRQDCEYFLGAGNRKPKYLWGGTVEDHILKMKELFMILPKKPEWISISDINQYEKMMTKSQ